MAVWHGIKAKLELIDPLKKLPTTEQEALEERKQAAKTKIARASHDVLEIFTASWQRDYDEVRSDWESVQSRSSNLLLAVGIISGLAGIASPFLARSIRIPVVVVALAIFVVLALG